MLFSLNISRKLVHSLQIVRHFAKRGNPGINYQIRAIEDAVEVIQSDPEGFEGLESDLYNVHKSHKEHELEQTRQRQKIKRYMIRNKYFRKDPLPNLLTHAEKEQIRYLHSSDPEEWTIDKLADSFPANAEIISKIVKSDWTAISSKRIAVHDANVMTNWERFKSGEYKAIIPKQLEEHLNKFANRNENDLKVFENLSKTLPKKIWQKPTSAEFSSIISSLRSGNIKPLTLEDKTSNICSNNETYLQKKIKSKKPITISELKNKHGILPNEAVASNELSMQNNKYITETGIANVNNNSAISSDGFYEKFASNEVNITEFDKKRYEISETKQRIHIPRKLWRKGATYRANNCFYDDDGELLYKVPGMFCSNK